MKKQTGKLLTALGVGTLLGASAGILFAPRKGSETRKMIKNSMANLYSKLSNINNKDVQKYVENKLANIELEIAKLDTTLEFKKAKRQAKKVTKKIDKLIKYTKKKNIGDFIKFLNELKEKSNNISEEVLTKTK